MTVSGDTLKASAVSSTVRPTKDLNSTTWLIRASIVASPLSASLNLRRGRALASPAALACHRDSHEPHRHHVSGAGGCERTPPESVASSAPRQRRFGSAFNLNVHVHALVLDGVYARNRTGRVRFWRDRSDASPDLLQLLRRIARRIDRLLGRRGLAGGPGADDAPDPWVDAAPALAGLAAASVQGVAALGRRAGVPVRGWGGDEATAASVEARLRCAQPLAQATSASTGRQPR